MTRRLLASGLLILTLLFVAACGGTPASSGNAGESKPSSSGDTGGSKPSSSGDASGGKPAEPAGGAKARPTAETGPAAEAEPTEAAVESATDTRDIQDISGSLDDLKSYRLQFIFSFDGKDEQGKPQKGSMEFIQEIIKGSNDQHIRWSATGDVNPSATNNAFEFFQVGGTSYIYSSEGQAGQKCIGMTSGQDSGSMADAFKPSDIIGGLKEARLVGKGETVNGVATDHYTFDESAVTFGAFASAQGDVWIAQDSGFLVKYVGTATGKNNFLSSKTAEGTFTWEYNVKDANQVDAIALPRECEGQTPAADIPVPENATDKGGFGKLLTFKSPDAPADVAAFYKQELPAQGWKAGEESALGELQTLSFSKEDRKISITITKEEQGGSTVLINEE